MIWVRLRGDPGDPLLRTERQEHADQGGNERRDTAALWSPYRFHQRGAPRPSRFQPEESEGAFRGRYALLLRTQDGRVYHSTGDSPLLGGR